MSGQQMRAGTSDLDALEWLARVVDHHGDGLLGVELFDVFADLVVVINEDEHRRRTAANLVAIRDAEQVELLATLPQHEVVDVSALTSIERRVLREVPSGAIQRHGSGVVRLAKPPVDSVLAVVHHRNWDSGMDLASRFAPVGSRVLVLPALPDEPDRLLCEATYYGIGVIIARQETFSVVVAPERWRARYWSAGGWMVREKIYAEWLKQHRRPVAEGQTGPVTGRG